MLTTQYNNMCALGSHELKKEGCGGLKKFAIAHCTQTDNCVLYRVFDQPVIFPEKEHLLGDSYGCGHYWAPPASIEGKSLKEYFKAAAVCPYPDKFACEGEAPGDGNKGGWLLRCQAKTDQVFAIGIGQSMRCETEGNTYYTLGPTAAMQILWGGGELQCTYCKSKESDASQCEDDPKPKSFNVTEAMLRKYKTPGWTECR